MTALAHIAVDPTVAAAAAGDRAAAEALCRGLLPRVRNLVRYLLRGDARVDDVAQEALIAVLRGLGSFRGEGAFEAWVDRVVARTTFSVIRRIRAETPLGVEPVDGDVRVVDRACFGEGYALRRELAEALDRLPFEQRDALILHFSLEMTVPEIAEVAAIPVETVRSRLRLGKAALREALGGSYARAI
jgi:RNA polymerase sigma-70 factor (ECF subfamily)